MSCNTKFRQKYCFVAGCYSSYKPTRQKISLFRAPKDAELLLKWKRIIGRTDRQLDENCVVCKIHFKEEDIIRNFKHIINGEEVLIPRTVPILTSTAVPTIFPQNEDLSTARMTNCTTAENVQNVDLSTAQKKRTNRTTAENVEPVCGRISSADNGLTDDVCSCNPTSTISETDRTNDKNLWFSFENLDNIEIPSRFWSLHFFPDDPNTIAYITCVLTNNCAENPITMQKTITVTKDENTISAKVYVRGVEIERIPDIDSKEAMERILSRIDNCQPCLGSGTVTEFPWPLRSNRHVEKGIIFSTRCTGKTARSKGGTCLPCKSSRTRLLSQKLWRNWKERNVLGSINKRIKIPVVRLQRCDAMVCI